MMKKILPLIAAAGMVVTPHALAGEQPATYEDGVLTIPEGVVVTEEGTTFYRDIELVEQSDGSFVPAGSREGVLAEVDDVNAVVDSDAGRVDVVASGHKSVACVEILEPIVNRQGQTFQVTLAESEPLSDVCIMILEAFETVITLDGSELESGAEYTVSVNGVEDQFTY